MDDIESVVRVARQLGMKVSEVLEVVQVDGGELADGGQLVRTHDGQWTLIRDDGTMRPSEAPTVTLERDSGVADPDTESGFIIGVDGPDPAVGEGPSVESKPAPKRRGR
jgi:hypothetical protein